MSPLSKTARGCKRKRGSLESCPSDQPPVKRRYHDGVDKSHWTPTPRFYDTLSKVRLTRGALKEFDRRIVETKRQQQVRAPEILSRRNRPLTRLAIKRLEDAARDGGPDLTYIRGFANSLAEMSHSSTSQSRKRSSTSDRSRPNRNFLSSTPRSTPYNDDYQQKLEDAGVYMDDYEYENGHVEEPANQGEIRDRLKQLRRSLSPSRFTDEDFKNFQRMARRAHTETSTMHNLVSVLGGWKHHSLSDVQFNRVLPFDEDIAVAKPDLYDAVSPWQVLPRVRSDLDSLIIPSNRANYPIAPNFFTECNSSGGRADVAKRQACHDGAIGARAMHSLQNYGREDKIYDGNAYSFSSTYHAGTGTLQMYATHPTAPKAPREKPEYHMTQLNSYALTGNIRTFREGATAYRNLRDLGAESRDTFIGQANTAPKAPGEKSEYHMTQLRSFAMTDSIETFRKGAAAYRNLRDLGAESRDTFIGQANTAARRMSANTPSSQLISSRTSRSAQPETDSDTSLNELACEEVIVKRSRRVSPRDPHAVSFTSTGDVVPFDFYDHLNISSR